MVALVDGAVLVVRGFLLRLALAAVWGSDHIAAKSAIHPINFLGVFQR